MVSYHLDKFDFNNLTFDNNNFIQKNVDFTIKNDKRFDTEKLYILKYNRDKLCNEYYNSHGKYRSIIFSDNKLVGFSPPKSINFEEFKNTYKEDECLAEDFIDGTMVNVFYFNNAWEISTKSCIGGNVSFFINEYENNEKNTFKSLFFECCKNANLNIENLEKQFSYTFVFQHPRNRIVTPIQNTMLYCIRIYSFNDNVVNEVPFEYFYENYPCFKDVSIYLPNRYHINSYDELINYYRSKDMPYYCVGIMIYHKDGARTKIRNPNYETIRKLRGNQPKLEYQYLCLRQENNVKQFLLYYPEFKIYFSEYKDKMHNFTNILYNLYKECFIFKLKKLKDIEFQYKIHIYNLHNIYLTELRLKQENINKNIVINYVNNLQPSQQMFALNFIFRKQKVLIHNKPSLNQMNQTDQTDQTDQMEIIST